MITFVQKGERSWDVFVDEEKVVSLSFSNQFARKFAIIMNYVQKLSSMFGEEFDNWLARFLRECSQAHSEAERVKVVEKNIKQIEWFVTEAMEKSSIDFNKFVDKDKAKKGSILFLADEMRAILQLSNCLKLFSLVSNDMQMRLSRSSHRKIYTEFAAPVIKTSLVNKIYDVVKTRTFRYNLTDRYMWDYIKSVQCKSIEEHVIEIFNFVMNHILILCEEDKNPITYFVGTIEESVKWFLRSVYKGSIVYADTVSTEEIHSSSSDNVRSFCYNDTLGRLKKLAYEKVFEYVENLSSDKLISDAARDENLTSFQNRISSVKFVSPVAEFLTYPIFSRVVSVPYSYFRSISPESSLVLSLYLQQLMQLVFGQRFSELTKLLQYYPSQLSAVATTYRIKTVLYFNVVQEVELREGTVLPFLSLMKDESVPLGDRCVALYYIVSTFVGRISSGHSGFFCSYTGNKVSGLPVSQIEKEMIEFFLLFFAGKLEDKFAQIKYRVEMDL